MLKPVVCWMWLIGLLCIADQTATAQSRTFDIYWVDVEGGAATLVVSPTGESLLVDTGFPGADDRDAKRIFAATQEAGLTRIDYLVITHFHRDHVGGLQALAEMIPIEKCFDHGTTTEESNRQWLDAYLSVCGDKRGAVEAGSGLSRSTSSPRTADSSRHPSTAADSTRCARQPSRNRRPVRRISAASGRSSHTAGLPFSTSGISTGRRRSSCRAP